MAESMVLYNVTVSPWASSQLDNCIDYIHYVLLNGTAAESLYQDALETLRRLSYVAESLQYCSEPILKKHGYRIINFQRHQYFMLYRVEGTDVYVEAVYHQSQNYAKDFHD